MTQNYELIVKGIRNFENKVTVTLALRDKKRFDGEIFDLDISLDRVEGAAGNDSNLLIVFYVQIMPDDLVMQLHRF